eukprot:6400699-Amphidinium_carterae.1
MHRTTVGQLLWVSQLRANIAFAVKLLRYIKGTIHYKLTLSPKATYNAKNEIQVDIESFADSDWQVAIRQERALVAQSHLAGEHLYFTSAGHSPQLIALSSAEAELYAMGQATIEAQHIK